MIVGVGRVLARPQVGEREDEVEDEVGTRAEVEEEAEAKLLAPSSASPSIKIEARRGGAGEAQSVQSAAGGRVGDALVLKSRSGSSQRGPRRGGFGVLRANAGAVGCSCIMSADTRMSDEVAAQAEVDAAAGAGVWRAMMLAEVVREGVLVHEFMGE